MSPIDGTAFLDNPNPRRKQVGMRTDHRSVSLPQEAMSAADRGDVIGAIKITRERTGLGLKEAKDAVDAYSRGSRAGAAENSGVEVPLDAIVSLHQGKLIDAIRSTRAKAGIGLKEAKEAVERYLEGNADTNEQFKAATARERSGVWRVVRALILIGVVILAYLWFSGKLA